jgi:hypothetical protein
VSLWLLGTIQGPAQTSDIDDLVGQMLAILVLTTPEGSER